MQRLLKQQYHENQQKKKGSGWGFEPGTKMAITIVTVCHPPPRQCMKTQVTGDMSSYFLMYEFIYGGTMCEVPPSLWWHLTHQRSISLLPRPIRVWLPRPAGVRLPFWSLVQIPTRIQFIFANFHVTAILAISTERNPNIYDFKTVTQLSFLPPFHVRSRHFSLNILLWGNR